MKDKSYNCQSINIYNSSIEKIRNDFKFKIELNNNNTKNTKIKTDNLNKAININNLYNISSNNYYYSKKFPDIISNYDNASGTKMMSNIKKFNKIESNNNIRSKQLIRDLINNNLYKIKLTKSCVVNNNRINETNGNIKIYLIN